ncbi:MAG: DUF4292 domain-containing protein [Chlorobaculum sp.]|nr:DUF4292 domain-containing protein [Chlorobaculum sp.]
MMKKGLSMKTVMKWVCLILLGVLVGCAETETITRAPTEPGKRVALTPELKRLYEEVASSAGMVRSLDGYADIYLKTPKRSNKAYCTVQLQKSRDARLIVTAGILGWPVADLLIRPDSLFVNDMLNNRMLVGRNTGENMGKIIGLDAGAGHLTETLFGIADLPEPVKDVLSVRQGGGYVSFTVKSGNGSKELVVDPQSRELAGIAYFDHSGRRSVEFRFADYQSQQGEDGTALRVPREIDMILYRDDDPEGSRSLKIVYDERVINPPDLTISFKRPRKAKTVNLDDVERLPWL